MTTDNNKIDHRSIAHKLAIDLKTNSAKGLNVCLALSSELFELGRLGEMPVSDFKSAMTWVSENVLPEKANKDDVASEKAASQARTMLYRRAVMVAFTLAGLKLNANPYSLKDKAVMLPGKIAGSELGGAFAITKAAALCAAYHQPKTAADVPAKMIKALTDRLNDSEQISDAATAAIGNLIAVLQVHLDRAKMNKANASRDHKVA